ncbi:MAG: helicase-related protein, partial [Pseudomonadota bacterium]
PKELRFIWLPSMSPLYGRRDIMDSCRVFFLMRDTLTEVLEDATKREGSELRRQLTKPISRGGKRVYLIYDECHQMGAPKLQRALRKSFRKFLGNKQDRFQVLGLSATPMPTDHGRHALLQKTIFPPIEQDDDRLAPGWGVRVVARLENAQLEERRILCPINTTFQTEGTFDIPKTMLSRVIRDRRVKAPPRTGRKNDLEAYAYQFNSKVMEDPRILDFLSEKLADNLPILGKTLVFVPTINAANILTEKLGRRVKGNRVSMVHSRLDETADRSTGGDSGGTDHTSPYQHIAEFRKRGSEPCIMVNVGMLTTGFDDPKIQTVLLGRLTFSTNLFWQMIGRGTRGPAAGGTAECIVIDPIRLTHLYEYTQGYRPTVETRQYLPQDRTDQDEFGEGALHPSVSTVNQTPASLLANLDGEERKRLLKSFEKAARSQSSRYDIGRLREVLRRFLAGDETTGEELVDLTLATRVTLEETPSGLRPSVDIRAASESGEVGYYYLEQRIRDLEQRLTAPLDFLRTARPTVFSEIALRRWAAQIDLAGKLGLRTKDQFEQEMFRRMTLS